ncbi:25713_t:CDS:2, partial [Racocetra persica]
FPYAEPSQSKEDEEVYYTVITAVNSLQESLRDVKFLALLPNWPTADRETRAVNEW